MASPLDYIKTLKPSGSTPMPQPKNESFLSRAIGGIVNKGKSFLTTPDYSTSGIVRNTITGIPQATKKAATTVKDFVFSPRGYTEQQLKEAKPTKNEAAIAIPRTGAEIFSSIGNLGAMALDSVPGHQENMQRILQTKTGSGLSTIMPKIEEFAKPKTAGEAKAMRYGDALGFLPIGSVKNIGTASKIIAGTKDAKIIATELKGLGLADDAIKTYAPILANVNEEKRVADIISKAYIPKPPVANMPDTISSIIKDGKKAPELAQQAVDETSEVFNSAEEFVQSKGTPVYHGTTATFDEFDLSKAGSATDNGMFGKGIYFTESRGEAYGYSKGTGNIKEAYLDMKKPYIINGEKDIPKIDVPYETISDMKNSGENYSNAFTKHLQDQGYDGVIDNMSGVKQYVVFDTKSIRTKSQLEQIWKEANTKVVPQADKTAPAIGKALPEIVTESGVKSRTFADVLPKSKVGFFDYFRTPDRVLEKLGFKKQMGELRIAHEKYLKDFQANVNKISSWRSQLPKESSVNIFRYLDGQTGNALSPDEFRVAGEIKEYLSKWADDLGLPQDKRVTNYITHLFDDASGVIDKDLAAILSQKLPKGVFNPYEMSRTGGVGYVEDTWKALDAYASKATRKLNLDEAIANFKPGDSLADVDFDYVKKFLDGINFRPGKLDIMLDNTIESVLSKFGKVGKNVSNKLGNRPTQKILSPLRAMGYRGTLGLNIGSALKNLSQGINTIATIGEKNAIKGYWSMLNKKNLKELVDEGVLNYGFIEDTLKQSKLVDKMDKTLFSFFEGAEKINRGAAYFGGKAKALKAGKTELEAIEYGKEIARKTQFQFGELDTPLFLRSQLAKSVFQLQSFTVKQVEFLVETAMKDKNFAGLLKYAVYGVAFQQTVGQLFNMEMKDLIPGVRLGAGLVFEPIVETGKAIIDAPGKYGEDRDLKTKATDVGKTLLPFIPASSQGKKTLSGINLIKDGGSFTDTGKKRFDAPTDFNGQLRSLLFGQYATEGGKQYIKSDFETTTVVKTKKEIAQEVLDKLKSGELGSAAVAKEYLKNETEKNSKIASNNRLALPKKEYAQALLKAIENKDISAADAKKELSKYNSQDKETVEKRGTPGLISDYAQAFYKDPQNAFKALLTKEQLGNVEGNLVQLQRFYGIEYKDKGGSEEKRKELMLKAGIAWSEKAKYNLEHITPVSAGGDNSDNNLVIVNRQLHDFYTPIDIAVGNAVKNGKITRKRAEELMRKLKVDKSITPEELLKYIK